MTRIIIEFHSPDNKANARKLRRQLIEAIEKAILSVEVSGCAKFKAEDFSAYMTFVQAPYPLQTLKEIQH